MNSSRKEAAAWRATYFLQAYGLSLQEAREASKGLAISVLNAADDDDRANEIVRLNTQESGYQYCRTDEARIEQAAMMMYEDRYPTGDWGEKEGVAETFRGYAKIAAAVFTSSSRIPGPSEIGQQSP